ncbi:hypothetical protein [Heliophilum fasciatum]|uniref:Uncharacterized protein n=1 Tax=Heliophilum fasciatum TaxID=35700 RepID=A0A4V2SX77_9FIRM|nr:hypothetical protein [Heliophilum fasciatum]MCW2277659.1 hypothetical protein [Heliophilum fasciatum]TCP65006.1 hypothetical protein EDD73_10778 [Heliophilum fasciatum]
MRFPFEVPFDEVARDLDPYVSAIFSSLESEFLVMPKGTGFIDYPTFEQGYEALKRATCGFLEFSPENVLRVVQETPLSLVVIRAILGLTPPEWAYLASQRTGIDVTQSFARTLDRTIRLDPLRSLPGSPKMNQRIEALIVAACQLLASPGVIEQEDKLHRFDKADTKHGLDGVRSLAALGAPYAMLLYERFLGRPFAGHRDSVSELVGDSLESAIESVLVKAGISYRKTKRAERIAGFDQAPDFIIPSEFNPQVVIEAKITEDDGTARDKVTRVQHLASLSTSRSPLEKAKFEVIACIGGRGFGVRREDMKKLILATSGKVFTAQTLGYLVEHTKLTEYRSR